MITIDLTGMRGIVTGASRGIGAAMAATLVEAGAEVHSLSRTLPENRETGIIYHTCDITDRETSSAVVQEIGSNGGIDFLINNAGVTLRKRAEELEDDEWKTISGINLDALFYLCRDCYPYLSKSPFTGRIVSISSMAAYKGFSEVAPYGITKTAVTGLTRALASEWAGNNILVNSIAPGWFPTELTRQVMDEDRKAKILSRIPMGRFGDPTELAPMAAFLLSPHARYITGQDIAVDGGALAFGY